MNVREFEAIPDDEYRHELIGGYLVAEPLPSHRHDRVRRRVERLLDDFVRPRGLGEVFGEAGYLLTENPDTVRGPDLSFVAAARLAGFDDAHFFRGAPDLAVEIVSPSNRPAEIRAKIEDYLDAGASAVWVVDPTRRIVTIYRARSAARRLAASDVVRGDGMLAGLALPVAALLD